MNLMIVDDEQLIRQGLAYILSAQDGIRVVAEASNGEEALALAGQYPIDIVLMDIRMPIMNGCEATKLIKEKFPHIKVLILTTFKDDAYIKEAIEGGASGYLLKDSKPELIYASLNHVCSGGFVLDEAVALEAIGQKRTVQKIENLKLTDRDIQLITLIAEGFSNKQIGDSLYLTEGTVKNNITTLLSKLQLKDRTQIVTYAFRNGIVV